ncbi:MAG: AAA-associated domain-containing protein [Dehalococcoidia bacterium]|nr:AAA-associated domain-containing protein [Dehalococcoidia bacterium]
MLLRAAPRTQLESDVIAKALDLQFPSREAGRQLDTAVNWGRYAELFSYDDSSGLLRMEANGTAQAG